MKKRIAVAACISSGKDLLSDIIVERFGYEKMKLGKYIRIHTDLFCDALGIPYEERRPYYQKYAETIRNNVFDPMLWIKVTEMEHKDDERAVCGDLRKFLEYEHFIENKYQIIAINCPRELREKFVMERDGALPDGFDHVTEIECQQLIDDMKTGDRNGFVINNNGTKEEYIKNIHALLDEMEKEGII